MTIRGLGAIGEDEPLGGNSARILAALIAAGPDGLTSDQLYELIWPGAVSNNPDGTVRQAVGRIGLPKGMITRKGGRYRLNLPNHEVDVWQLLNHWDFDLSDITDDWLRSLLTDEPYPGIDGPHIEHCRREILAARVELMNRLAAEAPDRITDSLLAASATQVHQGWDEALIEAVVRLYLVAGRDNEAFALLSASIERVELELGAPIGPALFELRNRLALDREPRLFGRSDWIEADPLVQREDLVRRISKRLTAGPVLLHGESGSGKTVIAKQIASQRFAGTTGPPHHVIWLVAHQNQEAAYAPFLAVFPSLHEALSSDLDPVSKWLAAHKHIHHECPNRPITLIVDDVQWLDDSSIDLVDFLGRQANGEQLEVLAIGRNDRSLARWKSIEDRFVRSGFTKEYVDQFSYEELVELIGLRQPQSTDRQRTQLADHVVDLMATLPAIATRLIASVDPATMTLPIDTSTKDLADRLWTSGVSDIARSVGSIGAVLGMHWTFGELCSLADMDPEKLAQALHELSDAGLVRKSHTEFSFRHALIRDAFTAALDAAERAALHKNAAQQTTSIHRRAEHLLAAGPSVDPAICARALIASGTEYAQQQSFLQAVRHFAAAYAIKPSEFDLETLKTYAYAIERSGGDVTAIRAQAFDLAEATGDPREMLKVLLAGVDPGEALESNGDRLDLIDRIPKHLLDPSDQLRLDTLFCRELGLAGQHERARQIYEDLRPQTVDEEAAAWLGIWSSLTGTPPDSWPDPPTSPVDITDDISRARVFNTLCERALSFGDDGAFQKNLAALQAEPASERSALRRWHLGLLHAVQCFVDGDWDSANDFATTGLQVGRQHGLAGATAAWTAQQFSQKWITNTHGDLLPILDAHAADVTGSLLGRAAHAAAMFTDDDRVEEARALVDAIIGDLDKTTSAVHAPIAATLSTAAPNLRPETRQRLIDVLMPHVGFAVIAGAGVAHLGPASWSLANLSTNHERKLELLEQAVHESEQWSLPVWQIRCLVDLAEAAGRPDLVEDAKGIAPKSPMHKILFEE